MDLARWNEGQERPTTQA